MNPKPMGPGGQCCGICSAYIELEVVAKVGPEEVKTIAEGMCFESPNGMVSPDGTTDGIPKHKWQWCRRWQQHPQKQTYR